LVHWRNLDPVLFNASHQLLDRYIVRVEINLSPLLSELLSLKHWILFHHAVVSRLRVPCTLALMGTYINRA
jgi:hypothetical protein